MRLSFRFLLISSLFCVYSAVAQKNAHHPTQRFDQAEFDRQLALVIKQGDVAFANFRGRQMEPDKWEADPPLPGAYFCDVDWRDPEDHDPQYQARIYCDYGEGLTATEAMSSLAYVKNALTVSTKPSGWRGIIKQGDDSFELFKPPDGTTCGWIDVYLQEDGPGTYRLLLGISSTQTPSEIRRRMSGTSLASMKKWVQQDTLEYVAAARTDFEQYKGASLQSANGLLVWQSKEKPFVADYCQVVRQQTNVFICQLSHYKTPQEATNTYKQLNEFVREALPDWSVVPSPFPQEALSTAYVSGKLALEGEIWIHADPDNSSWTVMYQLLKKSQ